MRKRTPLRILQIFKKIARKYYEKYNINVIIKISVYFLKDKSQQSLCKKKIDDVKSPVDDEKIKYIV